MTPQENYRSQGFADGIHAAAGRAPAVRPLSPSESLVLMALAYF